MPADLDAARIAAEIRKARTLTPAARLSKLRAVMRDLAQLKALCPDADPQRVLDHAIYELEAVIYSYA